MSVSRDGLEQLYGSACSAGQLLLCRFSPPQSAARRTSQQTFTPFLGRSTLLHQLLVHVTRIITMPVTHATYMLVAEAQARPRDLASPFLAGLDNNLVQALLLSLLLPSVHSGALGGSSCVHTVLLSPDVRSHAFSVGALCRALRRAAKIPSAHYNALTQCADTARHARALSAGRVFASS
jgi:hypothetical protein